MKTVIDFDVEIRRMINMLSRTCAVGAMVRVKRNDQWLAGRVTSKAGSHITIRLLDSPDTVIADAMNIADGIVVLYKPSDILYEAHQGGET